MEGALFQVSTAAALVEGAIEGVLSFKELKLHGDFGLGTVDRIDGELIILDGRFYQARIDGSVKEIAPDAKTPFAQITSFQPSNTFTFSAPSLLECEKGLIAHCENPNRIQAIRIRGTFAHLKLRIPPPVHRGGLKEAAAAQKIFTLTKSEGTALGFLSPHYLSGLSVAGLHLHFLTQDKKIAAHILDCTFTNLEVAIQSLAEYHIFTPNTPAFKSAHLNQDFGDTLHRLEKS